MRGNRDTAVAQLLRTKGAIYIEVLVGNTVGVRVSLRALASTGLTAFVGVLWARVTHYAKPNNY